MTETKQTKQTCAWESDLKVISHVLVQVPMKLLLVCNHIAARVDDNEFSIVTDILEQEIDRVKLSEEYYVPKQQVTPGSINYLSDEYHHSVVIHRHPDGHDTFSPTDRQYINQNFTLSLLYTQKDKFVNGVFNLKHDDAIVPIPVRVQVTDGLSDLDITNIETRRNALAMSGTIDGPVDYNDAEPLVTEEFQAELSEMRYRLDMMESYFYK